MVLSDEQVRGIHSDNRKHRIIAEAYGVSTKTVSEIKRGITHTDLNLGVTRSTSRRRIDRAVGKRPEEYISVHEDLVSRGLIECQKDGCPHHKDIIC